MKITKGIRRLKWTALAVILVIASRTALCQQVVSPLFARGYIALPEPQEVSLGTGDFPFGPEWRLDLGEGVRENDVAVEALKEDLQARFHIALSGNGGNGPVISLRIVPGSVKIGAARDRDKSRLAEQAYELNLHSGSIQLLANAPLGLFYGVETFVQLLRPEDGALWFPEAAVRDWPDLESRNIYWDDAHHLEKVDELKRILRQAAFYKINGVAIKLEGHFQYASAPAIVEPYALSPAELQELTDYGLRYHVQLIPYLDGPAHIAFILKHPEYARLREFPDSNYEICATNSNSYTLLEGMYQDLLNANKGVDTFYLSTDEPYYLGLARNTQCDEQGEAARLGSVGKLFAQFVKQTAGYLNSHGRKVVFWGEYPMKPADISSFPSYLINGEVNGAEFDRAFSQHGIRQMFFTSTEGEERLFPMYAILPESMRLHPDNSSVPRADDIFQTISFDASREDADLTGSVNAGWADDGVHPEAFWLGYVASAAASWRPASPGPGQIASSFYSLFYGPRVVNMDRVYTLMSMQAQTWTDSWESVDSTMRKPIWGSSVEIYHPRRPAKDDSLPLPPAPTSDLAYSGNWSAANAKRISLASQSMLENSELAGLLRENIQKADFNRYNLEVYLTIAGLCRQNLEMIDGIHRIDLSLASAARLRTTRPKDALAEADRALDIANSIWQQRNKALRDAEELWGRRWFPRVGSANGRAFLHELDDVKDHLPDRTVDLSYLVYRETILPVGGWVNRILAARNKYAAAHQLPARGDGLKWDSLNVVSPH